MQSWPMPFSLPSLQGRSARAAEWVGRRTTVSTRGPRRLRQRRVASCSTLTPPPQGEGEQPTKTARSQSAAAQRDHRAPLVFSRKVRLPGLRLHHSGDRSHRGCSRSTTRSALARNAADSASSSTSTPSWSSPTRSARCARAPSRRGRNRARPITCRRSTRSASTTASRSRPSGRTCRRRRRTPSCTARARPTSAFPTTTARAYETKRPFEGVITNLERRFRETDSDWAREEIARYFTDVPCAACNGYRLKPEALCVKIGGQHIGEVSDMSVKGAATWFTELPQRLTSKQNEIAVRVLKEIRERLEIPGRRRARIHSDAGAREHAVRRREASASGSPRRSAPA